MHTIIKQITIILLILNCVLIANSANPIIFSFDKRMGYKRSAITGDILLNIITDSLLDSLLTDKACFRVSLIIDKNGDILKVNNRSKGVPNKIASEFVALLKKNRTEFYFWVESTKAHNKKQDYQSVLADFNFPLPIHFIFPAIYNEPFFINYSQKPFKAYRAVPTREEIQKILNKYKDMKIETSRDFGITEKDYIEDPQRKKDILQQK